MKKIIALLFLWSGWAMSTNGYIQSTSSHGGTATFGSNVTAGNTIIVGCDGGSAGAVTVSTDTRGNTYTVALSTKNGSGNYMAVYYSTNAIGGSDTVYCNAAGISQGDMSISEYASSVTAGGFDAYSSSMPVAALAVATSGNATPSASNDLIFNFAADFGATASGANGTIRENYVFDNYLVTQDTIPASASVYASTFTANGSATWGSIQVLFLQNAVTPPVSKTGTHTYY